jgi:hypothetical protein
LHEISRREAVNRFYGAVQESLRADRNLRDLHSVLSDIAAANRSHADGERLTELAKTQKRLEFIEIFIVSFYALEATRIVGENLSFPRSYVNETSILAAVLGLFAVYVLSIKGEVLGRNARTIVMAFLIVLVVAWLAFGLHAR